MPKHHATHRKGMPKIVDPWPVVGAAIAPLKLIAQAAEDSLYLAQTQPLAQTLSSHAHEKRQFEGILNVLIA
jgi:hypothetical protein